MTHFLKKSLLLSISMVLPTFALTACAGNNQYGTVTSVSYTYDNSNNSNHDDFSFNQKLGFNNLSDTDITYQYDNAWKSYTANGYVESLSKMVVNVGLCVRDLVRASLVGFTTNQTQNQIFNLNPQTNNDFLQFLYASSDLLNSGDSGQIGFGLTGIETTISAPINPQTGGTVEVVSKDNKELGYTSAAKVTFVFDFGYWWSGNDNPTSNANVGGADVKNYVDSHNVWAKKFDKYYSSFQIGLNLDARLQSVFTVSDDWANDDSSHQALNNWTDGQNLKNTDGSGDYPLSETDLSQFKINNDSTFSSFNMQFESTTSQTSNFLSQFGTFDSRFGTAIGKVGTNVGTYDTFTTQYTTLNGLFSSSSPDFSGFANALTFIGGTA